MSNDFHPGTVVGDGFAGNLLECGQGYSSESDDVSISASGEIMPCRSFHIWAKKLTFSYIPVYDYSC